MIEVVDLYKSFGDNHVLKGFNLTIAKGENLAILGRSGMGKSVFIKCMVGLLKPDAGILTVFGKDVPNLKGKELNDYRQRIGFLFQGNALYDSMTVRENLEFPLRRHGSKKPAPDEMEHKCRTVLSSVGLEHTIDMLPAELSGGMKKRVALARTLIMDPDVILYDEPTSGLDPITTKEISNLIVEVQSKIKASAIVITHDIKCAHITANRIVVLNKGINYMEGTFDELNSSNDEFIRAFFH